MSKGKIIWLNGVSSSGKSTLAQTLQDRLSEPFYLLANDMFTDEPVCPAKFVGIDADATCQRALTGMYHAVKAFSDAGIHTVVDDVLLMDESHDRLRQCVELLHGHPVLFVHVTCPADELRRREEARNDRWIGMGESQLAALTPQEPYDIVVDTHENSQVACAEKIIEALRCPEKFSAFKTFWSRMNGKESGG